MNKGMFKLLFSLLVFSLGTTGLQAQTYSIDWFKISGGGGTSSNGNFQLSGTIGQADAGGPMTNGQYSLTGGFWTVTAVQSVGGPLLTVKLVNSTTVRVSWPSPATGFLLQQNGSLTTTNWSGFVGTTNDDGTNKSVTITPPTGNLFFRLKK